ncbi:hypothetical protein JCM19298_3503 [Nonlabens ulvanivorans]|nr:hypothetical protein [Nonlabens ulvanivorans]GAK93015.1 hypothetical protein JCM19298_3503 [Nonlabens ulvanivorans]
MFYNKGTSGPNPLQTVEVILPPNSQNHPGVLIPDSSCDRIISQPAVFIEHPILEDSFYVIVNGCLSNGSGPNADMTFTLLRFDSTNNTYSVSSNEHQVDLLNVKSTSLTTTLKYSNTGQIDGAWIITNRVTFNIGSPGYSIEFTAIPMYSNGFIDVLNPVVSLVQYNGFIDPSFNPPNGQPKASLKVSAQGNRISGTHELGFQSYVTGFNNVTGSVANDLTYLGETGSFFNTGSIYSEFSGDGSKLYTVSSEFTSLNNSYISQLSIFNLTGSN